MAAMPELSLLFIGTLAIAASAGAFVRFGDFTDVVVPLLAAVLWSGFALSSFDVDYLETGESFPITTFVYLGALLAAIMFLIAGWRLVAESYRETTGVNSEVDL